MKFRSLLSAVILLASVASLAQTGGRVNASDYAKWEAKLTADVAAGSTKTFTMAPCVFLPSNGARRTFNPIATANVRLTLDPGSSVAETVTPASVSAPTQATNVNGGFTCSFVATTSNAHSAGAKVVSGDGGINEAAQSIGTNGAGIITVGPGWASDTAIGSLPLTTNSSIIEDLTGQVPVYWTIRPSTLSALATPATRSATAGTTQVISGTATGTWTAVATYVCVTYVDRLGGESPCSATYNFTATVNKALNFASPAASTGAVGWRAYAGETSLSTAYQLPISSSTCTLSTQTPYNTCAIGSAGVFPTPHTDTALAPAAGGVAATYRPNTQSHTTFAYRPSYKPLPAFQGNYGPFVISPALTAGQAVVVGAVPLPAGYLNYIGKTVRVTGTLTNTYSTQATVSALVVALGNATDFTTGTPKTLCSFSEPTATGTVATKYKFECVLTTNATGATGTIMPSGYIVRQVTAAGTTGNVAVEVATAAITADLTLQSTLNVVFLQTGGAESTTPPQLQDLHIEEI